jgi:hypothetical protein
MTEDHLTRLNEAETCVNPSDSDGADRLLQHLMNQASAAANDGFAARSSVDPKAALGRGLPAGFSASAP